MTYEEKIFEEWLEGVYTGDDVKPAPTFLNLREREILMAGFIAGFDIAKLMERG